MKRKEPITSVKASLFEDLPIGHFFKTCGINYKKLTQETAISEFGIIQNFQGSIVVITDERLIQTENFELYGE